MKHFVYDTAVRTLLVNLQLLLSFSVVADLRSAGLSITEVDENVIREFRWIEVKPKLDARTGHYVLRGVVNDALKALAVVAFFNLNGNNSVGPPLEFNRKPHTFVGISVVEEVVLLFRQQHVTDWNHIPMLTAIIQLIVVVKHLVRI